MIQFGNGIRSDKTMLYAVLGLTVLANASGLFVTILEPDSASYASIAKTMVERHDFVDLFAMGEDWLDKPHLPFWLSAISFSVFGFSTWAYKLPALLLVLLSAYYTYLFARLFYDKHVALVAAIILLSAQHIIISSSDVRAEAYLIAFVIGSVYHLYQASRLNSQANLVAGSLLAAAAVMTKGIFALIPIGGSLAGGFLLNRQWTQIVHVRWLVATLLVFVFISPEIYCLWRQFDSHPEKVVFETTGVSGVRFFLWDSQFGRFFNTGPIRGRGNPFQYLQVILWAFLPWSPAFYVAAYDAIRKTLNQQQRAVEYFNLSGGLLTFLLFSASQFQLPHYLNIAFPFFAIMTAAFILNLNTSVAERLATVWQWLFVTVALIVCLSLQLAFPPESWFGPIVLLVLAALLLLHLAKRSWHRWQLRMIAVLATGSAAANLFLNGYLTPELMKYQAGTEMAAFLNTQYLGQPVLQLRDFYSWSLDFYLKAPVSMIDESMLQKGQLPTGTLIYGPAHVLNPLIGKVRLIHRAANYPISRLTVGFLNPLTRARNVSETWLVQIENR